MIIFPCLAQAAARGGNSPEKGFPQQVVGIHKHSAIITFLPWTATAEVQNQEGGSFKGSNLLCLEVEWFSTLSSSSSYFNFRDSVQPLDASEPTFVCRAVLASLPCPSWGFIEGIFGAFARWSLHSLTPVFSPGAWSPVWLHVTTSLSVPIWLLGTGRRPLTDE